MNTAGYFETSVTSVTIYGFISQKYTRYLIISTTRFIKSH